MVEISQNDRRFRVIYRLDNYQWYMLTQESKKILKITKWSAGFISRHSNNDTAQYILAENLYRGAPNSIGGGDGDGDGDIWPGPEIDFGKTNEARRWSRMDGLSETADALTTDLDRNAEMTISTAKIVTYTIWSRELSCN